MNWKLLIEAISFSICLFYFVLSLYNFIAAIKGLKIETPIKNTMTYIIISCLLLIVYYYLHNN